MLPFLCSPDIPIGSSTQLSLLPYTEMPIEADRMKKLHIKKENPPIWDHFAIFSFPAFH